MYSVTLRQLEVFRGVVNIGSFSGAARQLRISQPSVSMHIRALEDRLREPVFDRTRGKTPVLTDVGHRIYDHVEDVLEQPGGTLANVDTLKAVKENVLSLAAQRFIGNHLLSKPLARFAKENPGIKIIDNIGALDQVIDKIHNRDVDFGLFLAYGEVKSIRSEVLGRQKLVFVSAPGHPLAACRDLTYRDLADHPFISPVKDTQYGNLLKSVFADAGFSKQNTVIQSQNTVIRRELILSGVSISCALHSGWTDDLNSGELVTLDISGDPLYLEVRIGSLADRKISEASLKFVDFLHVMKTKGTLDS